MRFIVVLLATIAFAATPLPRPLPTNLGAKAYQTEITQILDPALAAKDATITALGGQLQQSTAALANANAALTAANTELGACNTEKGSLATQIAACDTELSTCEGNLAAGQGLVTAMQALFNAGAAAGITVPDAVVP